MPSADDSFPLPAGPPALRSRALRRTKFRVHVLGALGCASASGEDLLAGLAASCQEQGRLSDEAADPEVFVSYIKNYGPEGNLFVDHSQFAQLEGVHSGIWGAKYLFGRVLTYKDGSSTDGRPREY